MKKVIIYCRKSAKPKNTQERLEERLILSLESQEKELKEYAQRMGFQVVRLFKENESAYKTGRQMFNEMMELLETGKANNILVWHLTRIARNSYDGGRVIYLLDEKVLESIITPQKTYQNNGNDKFMLQLEFAMAKKSSDDTSSFVRRDIQMKAEHGEFPGKAPLGYLNIDKEGRVAGSKFDSKKQVMLEGQGRPLKRIEIDPIDGLLVRKVFVEASRGIYTFGELCDIAFKMGLRANRSGTKIVKASMDRMLENPFYYGAYLWEGQLYTQNVKHEALITKELFSQVQAALGKKGFRKTEKVEYKYTNTMICGECGSTVSTQFQKGHRYYHCTNYRAKKAGVNCTQKEYYREELIEEKIIKLLDTITIPPEFVEWGKSVIRDQYGEEMKSYEAQRHAQQNRLNEAKRKITNLLQLKISPQNEGGAMLSDEEYLSQKKTLQNEIATLESKLGDTSQNEANWLDNCEQFFDFTANLPTYFTQGDPNTKRSILKNLGKIVLNHHGELAFRLEEPYVFAAEIVKISNSILEISEPPKNGLESQEMGIPDLVLNKWRNGRGSNPRPPQ